MKVLHGDNKHNDDHLRTEIEINGGSGNGRRRSSTTSRTANQQSHIPQVNFQQQPQIVNQQQQQQVHRPHPHARSKDISKQNIIESKSKSISQVPHPQGSNGKKSGKTSSSDKEENTYQYYPSYVPHNPNVSVRPPDSPEQFGWAYGVNSCDSNHCSNCILNAPGHHDNPQGNSSYCAKNTNTNSLNRWWLLSKSGGGGLGIGSNPVDYISSDHANSNTTTPVKQSSSSSKATTKKSILKHSSSSTSNANSKSSNNKTSQDLNLTDEEIDRLSPPLPPTPHPPNYYYCNSSSNQPNPSIRV
jgi:hypothetical protein